MKLWTASRSHIETSELPGPSAVICMADTREQLAVVKDTANMLARLDLIFNDANDVFGQVRPPTFDDAQRILRFIDEHKHLPHLMIQCQVGIGRSQAVQAAMIKINGMDPNQILHRGTYNRRLYRLMSEAAGLPLEPEPLVSITVRVKYAPDRLKLFVLSMQRQRYENWEVVAVTDGPNGAAAQLVAEAQDPRVRLIETEKPLGRWGHPYRQLGLDACRGEFIGMSNDDNYYVPGYIEQMMHALANADLVVCRMLHSYAGWNVVEAGVDLGSWIARASLVRQVRWPGLNFTADRDFIQALTDLAKDRKAVIERPLFVHN